MAKMKPAVTAPTTLCVNRSSNEHHAYFRVPESLNAGETPSLPTWLQGHTTFNYEMVDKVGKGSMNVNLPGMKKAEQYIKPGTYIIDQVGNPEFLTFKQFNAKYRTMNPQDAKGETEFEPADPRPVTEQVESAVSDTDVINTTRSALTLLTDEAYLRGVRDAEAKFTGNASQKIDALLRQRLEPLFPKILDHHFQQIQLIINSLPLQIPEGQRLNLNMDKFPTAFRYLILSELGLMESIYDRVPAQGGTAAPDGRQDAAGPRQS